MERKFETKKREILEKITYEGIDYIELEFENCESVRIPRKYIGEFVIDNIKKSFRRTAVNHIGECTIAKNIAFSINRDYDIKPCPSYMLGQKIDESEADYSVFERINIGDITHITITYLWGETICYSVDYNEGDAEGQLDAINLNQRSVQKYGDLYISISSNDKEPIYLPNTEEERNYLWNIYSISVNDSPVPD